MWPRRRHSPPPQPPEPPVRAPAEPAAAVAASPPPQDLERLTAEARYHRERLDLYRARIISGSSHATSPARLRELERAAAAAQERLAFARRHP
jgi:hypothetical protein